MSQTAVYLPRDLKLYRDALDRLRIYFAAGNTAHTIVRHETATGNTVVSVLVIYAGKIVDTHLDVARILKRKVDMRRGGLVSAVTPERLIEQLSYQLYDDSEKIPHRPL